MFSNPVENWYTDAATVMRSAPRKEGNLTKQERETVADGVPCRVYRNSNPPTKMKDTAAQVEPSDMLACDVGVDIRAGDEILVTRGAALGHSGKPARYFAGDPTPYYEPFGGAVPNLAHQQVPLTGEKRN
jgi:hypothetical protein